MRPHPKGVQGRVQLRLELAEQLLLFVARQEGRSASQQRWLMTRVCGTPNPLGVCCPLGSCMHGAPPGAPLNHFAQ